MGNVAAARVLYENAQLKDVDSWAFRAILDDKVVNIDARAAAFADADPSNDPMIGSADAFCATCHQTDSAN